MLNAINWNWSEIVECVNGDDKEGQFLFYLTTDIIEKKVNCIVPRLTQWLWDWNRLSVDTVLAEASWPGLMRMMLSHCRLDLWSLNLSPQASSSIIEMTASAYRSYPERSINFWPDTNKFTVWHLNLRLLPCHIHAHVLPDHKLK